MGFIVRVLGGALVAWLWCFAAWAQSGGAPALDEPLQLRQLREGVALMRSGQAARAITEHFEPVIQAYEQRFRDGKTRPYSARNVAESLVYMLEAANSQPMQSAKVYAAAWGQAYFLKGYALVELQRYAEAAAALDSAIALSPQNAQYLTERGQLHLRGRNWAEALKTFAAAETAAREFSPPETRTVDLGRVLRGQAYARIELNELDVAEKLYAQCLELNPDDRMAQGQLRYIAGLRAHRAEAASAPADAAEGGFARAWREAEVQFAAPVVVDYVRRLLAGDTWMDQGVRKVVRMPDDRAVLECLTAIFPGPDQARLAFVIDDKGVVTAAQTDQPGWVAECIRDKLVGHRLPPPPVAPLHFCSRYEKSGENGTRLTHCGAVSLLRSCVRKGASSTCSLYSRP